ncbi:hypothetical protein KKH27_03255, partial [bacterium]|nr:hypothetical protein [bacterium]
MSRRVLFIFLMVAFGLLSMVHTAVAARIIQVPAASVRNVVELQNLGVALLDARVERVNPALNLPPHRVRWCEENGFVTGLAEEPILERLREHGIAFQDRG